MIYLENNFHHYSINKLILAVMMWYLVAVYPQRGIDMTVSLLPQSCVSSWVLWGSAGSHWAAAWPQPSCVWTVPPAWWGWAADLSPTSAEGPAWRHTRSVSQQHLRIWQQHWPQVAHCYDNTWVFTACTLVGVVSVSVSLTWSYCSTSPAQGKHERAPRWDAENDSCSSAALQKALETHLALC